MRSLRYYVLAGSLVWLAFGSFGALEPLFFRDVVGTGVQAIGWMNSLFGLGFMTGAALLPRLPRKLVSARGLAIAVCLTGLGTILYVGVPDLRVIAVGAFRMGARSSASWSRCCARSCTGMHPSTQSAE